MKKLLQRLLIGVLLGVGVYAGGAIYLGISELWKSLATFEYWRFLPVLALTFGNYLLRYFKWSLYLRTLEIEVPPLRNLTIFLGGLSMVVTPGKIGELLKAYLLKASQGVPMARTAPVVMAERITDLLALVLLMLSGVFTFSTGRYAAAIVGGMVLLFLVIVSSRRLSLALIGLLSKLPKIGRLGPKLEEFYEATALLFKPGPLIAASALSLAAWFCECLGFYLVIDGFPGQHAPLLLAVFIYSATTIGGLPAPGGLGLTEGGMATLLRYTANVGSAVAGAATLIIRLCTLWFAVIVGVLALLVFRRSVGLGDEAAVEMSDKS